MAYHLRYHVAKLRVESDRIIAMNSRDQVRTLANVNFVLLAPLDPLVILIACLHDSRNADIDFAMTPDRIETDAAESGPRTPPNPYPGSDRCPVRRRSGLPPKFLRPLHSIGGKRLKPVRGKPRSL